MEKRWKFNYVYITTNLIDGKQYVGDHSTNNLDDGYLGSGIILCHSIKKYGKEKFDKKILEFFYTKQEAFDTQVKYINEYNTARPHGYNISPKGGHQCNGGFAEETKTKISKTVKRKYKENPEYREKVIKSATGVKQSPETIEKRVSKIRGKNHSEETKKLIGDILRGRKHTKESRKNMSEAHKGQKAWNKGKTMSDEQKKKN